MAPGLAGLAMLFAATTTASAQTPPKQAVKGEQMQSASAASGGGDKASVEEVAPPPPQPVRTEILAFENWTVTCREFAAGGPPRTCQAVLQVVQQQQQEGGPPQVLLAWILSREGQGAVTSTLQTPTGVVIAPGVELALGKAAARKLAYTACEARCAAVFAFDDAFAKEAAAAESAQAAIAATNGKTIRFTFPVTGFDRAWAALRK